MLIRKMSTCTLTEDRNNVSGKEETFRLMREYPKALGKMKPN